jgi:SAM-dependent methyltransferase
MYREILSMLACPECGNELNLTADDGQIDDLDSGQLQCTQRHVWPIEDGVAVFTREDAPSDPWSRSFAAYEKFVANKEFWIPNSAKEVEPIIQSLPRQTEGPHLDLCTGDGRLLFNLLRRFEPGTPVVSVDMSLHAQKLNHRYATERNHAGISFISADAANLPFVPNAFRSIAALGLGNTMGKMEASIREAVRVLTPNGCFAMSHFFVGERSRGWERFEEALLSLGEQTSGYVSSERQFGSLLNSPEIRHTIDETESVVGDPDRDIEAGPIFPYPNESMKKVIVVIEKQ